jgi:hypothetical protein
MPKAGEIATSLYGAWRLAHLDAGGMRYFGTSVEAFWGSFFAAIIVGPFFSILMVMRFELGLVETTAERFVAVEAIAYVIAWVVFPYIMLGIARLLERDEHYVRFIVAYNWAAVLQNALYMPIVALTITGAMPPALASALGLITLAVILFYTWFITRTALDIAGPAAVAIVLLDLILSIFVDAYADSIL